MWAPKMDKIVNLQTERVIKYRSSNVLVFQDLYLYTHFPAHNRKRLPALHLCIVFRTVHHFAPFRARATWCALRPTANCQCVLDPFKSHKLCSCVTISGSRDTSSSFIVKYSVRVTIINPQKKGTIQRHLGL